MWNALKSDLLDFVAIIQEDTSKTLSLVLGEKEVDGSTEEENLLKKLIANTKRSYETFAHPLKERRAKEFERFKKMFDLTMHSSEITEVLDEEPEVSLYYSALVPIHITPDEFWARLFFRLQLLTRTGNVNYEDDNDDEQEVEEELIWDEVDDVSESINDNSVSEPGSAACASMQSLSPEFVPPVDMAEIEKSQLDQKIQELEDENQKLRNMISFLTYRITQLELDVKIKSEVVTKLQEEQSQARSSARNNTPAVRSMTDAETTTPSALNEKNTVTTPTRTAPRQPSDTWSEASSEGQFVNHSEANSLTYGTDEETSRHGVGGKATLIMSSNTPSKSISTGDQHSTNYSNYNPIQPNYNYASLLKNVTAIQTQPSTFFPEKDKEEDGWN